MVPVRPLPEVSLANNPASSSSFQWPTRPLVRPPEDSVATSIGPAVQARPRPPAASTAVQRDLGRAKRMTDRMSDPAQQRQATNQRRTPGLRDLGVEETDRRVR